MGYYVNSATDNFFGMIPSKTFVDHTEMLQIISERINDPIKKYIAISRPRRFGKTVDANMIASFFGIQTQKEPFQKLKISEHTDICAKHQGKYHVIMVDMSKGIADYDEIKPFIQELESNILSELKEGYSWAGIEKEKKLYKALAKIYEMSSSKEKDKQIRFMFIIDEWDAPLRLRRNDGDGQKYYISWLNDLFKGQGYLALAYMTGILPIKKYGDDSLMNMFYEYSMLDPYDFAPYMGFTEQDVTMLCERYQRNIAIYRKWYNGYLMTQVSDTDTFSENGDVIQEYTKIHVYNPKSITMALDTGRINDYWTRTGDFEALKDIIDTDTLGIRTSILEMMKGEKHAVNTKEYKNNLSLLTNINQVFTLLIHLGYLTYDAESKEVYIPNRELMEEFATATSGDSQAYSILKVMINDSMSLLQDTWNMKASKVASAIEKAHMFACSPKDYNNELALSITVSFAYIAARDYYTIIPEAPAGKGYADLIFIPKNPVHPAMVIELKWNKDAETAIDQIRNKEYSNGLIHYAGNILCVGISYEKTEANDPQYKKHSCVIEKM